MGKKIIGVIAFAAIAAVAGWNYQQNKNEVQLSDLALENVEALAWDENKSNYHCFHVHQVPEMNAVLKTVNVLNVMVQRIVDNHVQITISLFMHNLH